MNCFYMFSKIEIRKSKVFNLHLCLNKFSNDVCHFKTSSFDNFDVKISSSSFILRRFKINLIIVYFMLKNWQNINKSFKK
jgi:hypothetical protein